MVRHHASRRGEDHDPQTIIEARQFLDLRIDAPSWLGDACDFPNDRSTLVILQLDHQLIEARGVLLHAEVTNVPLTLQDFQDVPAQLGGRSRDLRLARPLSIPDTGQHIPEGIAYRHAVCLLTSSPWSCPGSAQWRRAPAGRCA